MPDAIEMFKSIKPILDKNITEVWYQEQALYGYKVGMATITNGKVTAYEPFISGWLNDQTQKVSGRPVDILILNDGSMLVSDDNRGLIYRITYKSNS